MTWDELRHLPKRGHEIDLSGCRPVYLNPPVHPFRINPIAVDTFKRVRFRWYNGVGHYISLPPGTWKEVGR